MILKVIVGGVVVFLAVWAWKIHIYLKRQKRKERDQEEVWCGLGMCQCGTFKADHLPCKHIYKLALIRGMIE